MTIGPRYRVVQWATGNIGMRALRAVVEHPHLDLVGVYVHSPEKAGRDAGELCGLGATGITATRDIEEILALGADCVLYMPIACDLDEVCRLLAGGANVVTTRGEFHHPASMEPRTRERVEAACAAGAASIHSTGSSPGFITEAVPLVLTSIQRRLANLTINEYADLSRRDSPGLLFGVMGFGRAPSAFDERRLSHARVSFGPSLRLVADALAVPLDDVEASGEFATARHTTEIAAGTIEAGTVAAQRITAAGMRGGEALLRFRATWYCTTDIDQDWDLRHTGWRVTVDGDAPMDIDIRFAVTLDQMAAVTPGYTANRAVNAVPFVCAAAPGIRSTVDLPQIVAALG
jgi:4-hydroxy-tetrahydrodipicolinate reductase